MNDTLEPILAALVAEAALLQRIVKATREGVAAGLYSAAASDSILVGVLLADSLARIVRAVREARAP